MRPEFSTKALQYVRNLYAEEDELLQEIVVKLKSLDRQIQIGPEEGRLLQVLIQLSQVKNIVEIGTLGGYSAIWMARALSDDGVLHTIEKEYDNYEMAKNYLARSEVGDKIVQYCGDARKMLEELSPKGPFDMVFIDADKISYEIYLDWAEVNIRQGGIIIADNTFLFDSVYEDAPLEGISLEAWNTMRRFNERLADSSKYLSILLPTKEGLSVAIRR